MRTSRYFRSFFFLCLIAGTALAVPISASDFHAKVVALYSFEPHRLKDAEMEAKSVQLDKFWSDAKADASNTLPLLRKELADPSNSAFFFYDGSKLLLSLSKDKSDLALALRSIPKADLQGIQHTDYLLTVKSFASNGFDTRDAAFRVLAFPDFKAFIPAHALTLGQNYALIYMLFPMKESLFASDLTRRLATEKQLDSQKSLLLALWYLATPEAKTAMAAFANDAGKNAEARSYAKLLLARKSSGLGLARLFSSEEALREERRKVMMRPISDEALMELDQLTLKIIAKH
jgi:hypothetical protein